MSLRVTAREQVSLRKLAKLRPDEVRAMLRDYEEMPEMLGEVLKFIRNCEKFDSRHAENSTMKHSTRLIVS